MNAARLRIYQEYETNRKAELNKLTAEIEAYKAKQPISWKNAFQTSVNYAQPTNYYLGQNYPGQNLKEVKGSSKLQAAAAPPYNFKSGKQPRIKRFF